MKIRAVREIWCDDIALYISPEPGQFISSFNVEPLGTMGVAPNPSISFALEDAQRLMDELWNCGLRPSEGTGSAGSLAATESHLSDMRRLLFHKMGVKDG